MYIKWSEDLSVGVELIDEQHKEMFNRINRLLRAIGEIGGAEQVVATADFLQDYVVQHFAAEEEQMVLHEYPGLASHKEHKELLKEKEMKHQRLLKILRSFLMIALLTNYFPFVMRLKKS